jgi:hypothetical protein
MGAAAHRAFRCIFLPSKKGKKDAASIPAPVKFINLVASKKMFKWQL